MIKIDKDYFIQVTNSSMSMMQAAAKLNIHYNTFRRWAKKFGCYKPNQGGAGIKKERYITPLKDILEGKHPEYHTFKLKTRLIREGILENKCSCCGITEWNGKPIHCELHHKDGNRTNHKLDNIELLCPNCHSQTKTFRSLNKKHIDKSK